MKAVEEALRAKGYEVGQIDGVADDDARAAIRAFQQDAGIPITGMVDQRTADRLDVAILRPGSSPSDDWNNGQSERNREWDRSRSDSNMTTPGDDQSLPSHFRN
jgi:peptidoglycan hydrolase-like protein with peptidoglycan-binding domain